MRRRLQQAVAGRGPGLGWGTPSADLEPPQLQRRPQNILFLIFSSRAARLCASGGEGRPKAPGRALACEELRDHLSFALGTLTLPTDMQAAVRPCTL